MAEGVDRGGGGYSVRVEMPDDADRSRDGRLIKRGGQGRDE